MRTICRFFIHQPPARNHASGREHAAARRAGPRQQDGLIGLRDVVPRPQGEFFFIFLFFFVDLSKIYVAIIFFQKYHPAAGWFGGKELPSVHPAVRSLAHGPWKIPPVQMAVAPYRQTNRR